jgi:hypothetical protein
MDSINNIQKLAWAKFGESECLFSNNHYDWAYYTCGYTVELLLKAKVCKTLGIENFFDEKGILMTKLKYPQTFKIHNVEQLLVLSGIYKELLSAASDVNFKTHWSSICRWNEDCRYLTGKPEKEVKDFLISVKEIAQWIQNHL